MGEGLLIVGGLLALGAGGAIAYKLAVAKPAVAAAPVNLTNQIIGPSPPAPAGRWVRLAGSGTIKAVTGLAISMQNPAPALVSLIQGGITAQTTAGSTATPTLTAVHFFPIGSALPAGWPKDDLYGTTAWRASMTTSADMPFDMANQLAGTIEWAWVQ